MRVGTCQNLEETDPLTILLMHAFDLPDIHATLDHVKVELVEERRGSESGAREIGKWMGIQPVDDYTHAEEQKQHHYCQGSARKKILHCYGWIHGMPECRVAFISPREGEANERQNEKK